MCAATKQNYLETEGIINFFNVIDGLVHIGLWFNIHLRQSSFDSGDGQRQCSLAGNCESLEDHCLAG